MSAFGPTSRGKWLGMLVWLAGFILTFQPSIRAAENQTGQKLRVGFWNVRDLSVASRDANELNQIASIAHSMDCVALCEVNDGSVIPKLKTRLKALGGNWAYTQTTAKVGNTPSTAERYGFLYRSEKLKVRGKPRVLPELSYVALGESRPFDREPFVTSFKTLDERFDFTVIVVHITWGAKAGYRIGEIHALTNYFNSVQNGSWTDDDVILCGDFNRNAGDASSLGVLQSAIPGLIDTTSPDVPTKIDTSNTYDHLMFQTNFVTEYTGLHGVIRFDEEMFADDDELASETCSDHRPVWAEFVVPAADDD